MKSNIIGVPSHWPQHCSFPARTVIVLRIIRVTQIEARDNVPSMMQKYKGTGQKWAKIDFSG
jgi:hypothetical protein